MTDEEIAIRDVVNLALSHLGEPGIEDLENDNTVRAIKVRRQYAHARDALLRGHPWNFAIKRAALEAAAEAPDFGPAYAYDLPADCLRILTLNGIEAELGQSFYTIESGQLLTDADEANVTYIRQVTDPNEWDANFIEAFALKLASDVALDITQSTEKAGLCLAKFQNVALPEAQLTNTQEDDAKVISPLATSRTIGIRRGRGLSLDTDW